MQKVMANHQMHFPLDPILQEQDLALKLYEYRIHKARSLKLFESVLEFLI